MKNLIKIIKQEKQTRLRFIEDAKKKSLLIDMEMASEDDRDYGESDEN